MGVDQVLAVRPTQHGHSGIPATPRTWYQGAAGPCGLCRSVSGRGHCCRPADDDRTSHPRQRKALLERHMAARPGFADYAARTSGFFPRPPKRT